MTVSSILIFILNLCSKLEGTFPFIMKLGKEGFFQGENLYILESYGTNLRNGIICLFN